MTENIILIGAKSCGKSSTGKVLAQLLHCPFIDTDHLIEHHHHQQYGIHKSFADIYATMGKIAFGHLEQQIIRDLGQDTTLRVIATGGGSVCRSANQRALTKLGTLIYLQADFKTLLTRWHNDPPKMIAKKNIELALQQYCQARLPIYASIADITLCVDNTSTTVLAKKIKACIDTVCK